MRVFLNFLTNTETQYWIITLINTYFTLNFRVTILLGFYGSKKSWRILRQQALNSYNERMSIFLRDLRSGRHTLLQKKYH